MTAQDHTVLVAALTVAVPLRMIELRHLTPRQRHRTIVVWAHDAAEVIAHRGDQLMFRTPQRKGEGGTADTFNHLVRGLAALAHVPGGVVFAGMHWCLEHPHGIACDHPGDLECETGEPVPSDVEYLEYARPVVTIHPVGEVL